ncbi:hypothetical protein cce_2161 [Crocosphaera subtropica ATCC 51142]|uniref:Uncharacterized protein n=1 Tax=Crocosphaera subtropica (strain ATCC 51142 / BH68) TaxID=43989 RepID=B1WNT2_CROS5|nr:hypothetical protein [Crocosphaera subtropica]ACB51511.1 hypothetical protein cce_2161 [Crocosphaera subtropica ATCC 51142]
MDQLTSYWQLYQVRSNGTEYKKKIEAAEKWLKDSYDLTQWTQEKILNNLLNIFKNTALDNLLDNLIEKGKSGLCLRCYISEYIVTACKKRASLFSSSQGVTYQALLPFVLDDDGKSLIIIDQEDKQQLEITDNGKFLPKSNNLFTVEVINSYKNSSDNQTKLSLRNWTYLKTKQNKKIVDFLAEFGFSNVTDWSLLNRVKKYELQQLTEQEQSIIKVYAEVYKRDRRQNQYILRSKCQPPSVEQLQEMINKLNVEKIQKPHTLLNELKRIAKQLRRVVVSLDSSLMDKEGETTTLEVPYHDVPIEEKEKLEIFNQIQDNLMHCFQTNIGKVVQNTIQKLQKSKSYSLYASQYIYVLKSFYQEGKSISNIAKEIGIEQYKASRIFSPKNLLKEVRKQTVDDLINAILKLIKERKLITEPFDHNYLTLLTETVEQYADKEIFAEASAQIMTSTNNNYENLYTQTLIEYLTQNS